MTASYELLAFAVVGGKEKKSSVAVRGQASNSTWSCGRKFKLKLRFELISAEQRGHVPAVAWKNYVGHPKVIVPAQI